MEPIVDAFSKFAEVVLVGLLPVLAVFVIRWVKVQIDHVLAKIEAEKPELFDQLEWVAALAVRAAEEAKFAGLVEEKRKYAFDVIKKFLEEGGYPINVDLIYAAIEAAVLKEFNREKVATATFEE
jgi:hypothetical protein